MNCCRICGSSKIGQAISVKEMMFGSMEDFVYFQCSFCGCLQISAFPNDISKYYPREYYSFNQNPAEQSSGMIRRCVSVLVDNYLREECLVSETRIMDVGCGNGAFVYSMVEEGFMNVTGIDKFIDGDIYYNNGAKVIKGTIFDLSGEWDIIMFHHSLEHMPDQVSILAETSRLLSRDGLCMIRTPTVSSYAWEFYGANWVQIDAPRHLFIHSHNSIRLAAQMAGLKLHNVTCDSTEFQFWGSEQYARGIPLRSQKSYADNPLESMFSLTDIAQYRQRAQELNVDLRGDQAVYYFAKS